MQTRVFTAVTVVAWGLAAACGPADLNAAFDARIAEVADELIDVRRDLHRHPEVSGAESRTAGLVARRLEALGYAVRTGVGGHGVVAVRSGRRPGPVVAFRADMDAVRSEAPDPVSFASEVPGVRHICGHDVHTAIGLAIAEGFAALGDDLPGTVMLLFQPAEETGTGARAMLEAGAFDDPTPEAIFAVHSAPLEVGQFATASVTLMPARDVITVTADGRRALAVVQEARRLIDGAGTIRPEQAFVPVAGDFAFVNTGAPRAAGGTAWSVEALLTLSSETARVGLRDRLLPSLQALGSETTPVRVDYQDRVIDGVTNDPGVVARARESIHRTIGDGTVALLDELIPAFSEDFGAFQRRAPGAMFFLGVSNRAAGTAGLPHHPDFVADEAAIATGARAMGAVMLDRFAASPGR